MPDRVLEQEWPEYFNSTGEPDNGTVVDENLLDAMKDALDASLYADELDEGPPEIAREVVEARPNHPNLKARLDALEALAAGGLATAGAGGMTNLIVNDTFLVWSSALPDNWQRTDAGLTVGRHSTQGYGYRTQIPGRNFVGLVNAGPGARDFYIDVISAAELTSFGAANLKQAPVAGGIFINTDVTELVEVYVDDGTTTVKIGGNESLVDPTKWIWSASTDTDQGAATLSTTPSRLRFIVRLKGAGTAYVAGATLGFGESCPRYSPAAVRHGQVLWGVDSATLPTAGVKATMRFPSPTFVYQAEAYCTTAPAGAATTLQAKNSGAAMFTNLQIGVGNTTSNLIPANSVELGSFGAASILTFEPLVVDAATRGLTLSLRYLQYVDPVAAFLGGRVAI